LVTGVALSLMSCNQSKKENVVAIDTVAYKAEIEEWHGKRVNDLKAPNGWLNLIGLLWLEEGLNTFGSDKKNNIVFPVDKIPAQAGYFSLKQNTVTLDVAKGVNITSEGQPVKSLVIFNPDSTRQPVVEFDSLRWAIIKRDDKFGVRLRDLNNPDLKNFKGIDRYSIDTDWRLEAKWEPADSTRTIEITNVLGQTTAQSSPGTLVFSIDDKEYKLDVLKGNKEEYFVIFADATTGKETYGAGRFIYVKKQVDGKTIIDFNKSYNPPCAFTEYATCPLPPKQNTLTVAIEAGEKNYGTYVPHEAIH
ncbi:MAG TPA: DUF1684 domain-containing protein, partial [Cyclobacteriaceae bacterium]